MYDPQNLQMHLVVADHFSCLPICFPLRPAHRPMPNEATAGMKRNQLTFLLESGWA